MAGGSSAIRLWDTTTGKPALSLEGHQDAVAAVAFSPDGKRLASWGGDRSVRTWDLGSFKEERVFSIGPGQCFGHDERFFRFLSRELAFSAEPALRETLAGSPPVETRNRCTALLEALQKGTLDADGVRGLRAVQLLERIGSPEARGVLKTLADGAPGRLSREARLALDRLERHAP